MDSDELKDCLRRLGLVEANRERPCTPLSGGVSSDISLVEAGGRRFCVKLRCRG